MTDNPTSIFDGDGRYGSRTRVNREFVEIDMPAAATVSQTIQLNGKVSRVVLDPSRITSNGSVTATSGTLQLTMDIEDSGGTEYPYCDTVSFLDYRTASNTPLNFQTSEGGNMNADAGTTTGLHFTVTAPASSKTGGVVIDEPAPWSGLVCGALTITLATTAGAFTGGTARLVIIYE
tara:strand:+ start:7 stop:537 length:531 start_codon:yes stop_codon:yes gene_type:complete